MIGARKKFSQKMYDTYDGPAKLSMKVHLELSGHIVTVPDEDYGVDLYSVIGDLKMYHEVEVFEMWRSGDFMFPTGSVPARKIRLKAMHTGLPLYFWRLRQDLQRALVFGSHCLKDKYLVEVPNREIPEGEYFYRIPVTLGKEFDLLPIKREEVL